MADRWKLYLDVDGVLNAWQHSERHLHPKFRDAEPAWPDYEQVERLGYTLTVSPRMGDALLALGERHDMEIVWATTWCGNDPSALIGGIYGWPEFRELPYRPRWSRGLSGCGKLDVVRDDAGDAGVIWVDDCLAGPDIEWIDSREHPTFGVKPSPFTGLTVELLDGIDKFVTENRSEEDPES